MSADGGDPGQLAQLWKWATAGIGAVALWLWHNTMGRIAALEHDKLDKAEFEKHVASVETTRKEFRENQIAIFDTLKNQDRVLARIEGKIDK